MIFSARHYNHLAHNFADEAARRKLDGEQAILFCALICSVFANDNQRFRRDMFYTKFTQHFIDASLERGREIKSDGPWWVQDKEV